MATEKADFSRLTILLIDDNKFIRKLVGKVIEADSADAAMLRMGDAQPDVIFCDWLMEGRDGLDVLRMVRGGQAPIDPKTPFIMLTGERRADHVATAIAEGADSYIAKPVSAAILMSHPSVKSRAVARDFTARFHNVPINAKAACCAPYFGCHFSIYPAPQAPA